MDSEIQRDGRVLDLTDDAWREDRLPYEDVTIPLVNANNVLTACLQSGTEISHSALRFVKALMLHKNYM